MYAYSSGPLPSRSRENETKRRKAKNPLKAANNHLLLRQFEDAILTAADGLSVTSSQQIFSPATARSSLIQSSLEQSLQDSRIPSSSTDVDGGNVDSPGLSLDLCLQRLASLTTTGNRKEIDATPYMVVIVQSLFELEFQSQKKSVFSEDDVKYHQQILEFLWNFYGSIYDVPYKILFLTINLLIIGHHHKEARSMLHYSLEIDSPSLTPQHPTMRKTKRNLSPEEAEKLVQVYLFHVLPKMGLVTEGLAYLETPIDVEYETESQHHNPLGLIPKEKRQMLRDRLMENYESQKVEKPEVKTPETEEEPAKTEAIVDTTTTASESSREIESQGKMRRQPLDWLTTIRRLCSQNRSVLYAAIVAGFSVLSLFVWLRSKSAVTASAEKDKKQPIRGGKRITQTSRQQQMGGQTRQTLVRGQQPMRGGERGWSSLGELFRSFISMGGRPIVKIDTESLARQKTESNSTFTSLKKPPVLRGIATTARMTVIETPYIVPKPSAPSLDESDLKTTDIEVHDVASTEAPPTYDELYPPENPSINDSAPASLSNLPDDRLPEDTREYISSQPLLSLQQKKSGDIHKGFNTLYPRAQLQPFRLEEDEWVALMKGINHSVKKSAGKDAAIGTVGILQMIPIFGQAVSPIGGKVKELAVYSAQEHLEEAIAGANTEVLRSKGLFAQIEMVNPSPSPSPSLQSQERHRRKESQRKQWNKRPDAHMMISLYTIKQE
ncbi:hypothetical protein PROFUN_15043 [Planoprotostelium fungivorum]|uniref:Uncharacterized protein n=1 Tax=Planoprotostelium fungivorum TaxID=1890364 RepID=A0A2P6MZM4_9EUKA|nr:hypothetical protein PROFUN_15043 [Planoprotostelium fungivorum]